MGLFVTIMFQNVFTSRFLIKDTRFMSHPGKRATIYIAVSEVRDVGSVELVNIQVLKE